MHLRIQCQTSNKYMKCLACASAEWKSKLQSCCKSHWHQLYASASKDTCIYIYTNADDALSIHKECSVISMCQLYVSLRHSLIVLSFSSAAEAMMFSVGWHAQHSTTSATQATWQMPPLDIHSTASKCIICLSACHCSWHFGLVVMCWSW